MTTLAETSFSEYRKRVFRQYEEGNLNEALGVAREASAKFPGFDPKTSFWIACLQARLGNPREAIHSLQVAVKRGVWWRTDTLQDSDLDSIRDMPEFLAIQAECKLLQEQSPKTATPELVVRAPDYYNDRKAWPLLMTLHQRYGEHPEISAENWRSITSIGTILAAPWSSQVYAADGRCWDDWETADREVKWAYNELSKKYRVDSQKVFLGGFSQGAALSISAVLKRLLPSRGFVAVAPSDWVRPEEKRATERSVISEPFASFVRSSNCAGLKGVIIVGDQDPFFSKIEELYALMIERGLEGKVEVVHGLGHEYPEDFGARLRTAVEFLQSSRL